jgi:hypothetical protein
VAEDDVLEGSSGSHRAAAAVNKREQRHRAFFFFFSPHGALLDYRQSKVSRGVFSV